MDTFAQTESVQGRYIRQGDIIILRKPARFFGTRKVYFLVLDGFTERSGWDIAFPVRDLKDPTNKTQELTLDMMEYFTVHKVTAKVK